MPITDEEVHAQRSFCAVCDLELVLTMDADAEPYRGQDLTVVAAPESPALSDFDASDPSLGRMTACPACAALVWLPVAALERKRGRCATCNRDFALARTARSPLRSVRTEDLRSEPSNDPYLDQARSRSIGVMVLLLALFSIVPAYAGRDRHEVAYGSVAWVGALCGGVLLVGKAIDTRDGWLLLLGIVSLMAVAVAFVGGTMRLLLGA